MTTMMTTRRAAAAAMVAGMAVSFSDAQIFQRAVGDRSSEWHYSVDTTMDKGSVSAGFRRKTNGDTDFHIVKYFADGTTEWEVTFGGDREDVAYSVQQTKDGGYIVAGESRSFEAGFEIVLLRLDAAGNQLWANAYPGSFMADPIHLPHPGVALDQGWEDEIYVVGRLELPSFPGGPVGGSRPVAFRTDMAGTLEWYQAYEVPTPPEAFAELAFTDVAYSEADRTAVISGTVRLDGPLNPDDPTFFMTRQDATLLKVSADPGGAGGAGGVPFWFLSYDSVFDRDNPDIPNVWETGDGLDIAREGEIILAGRSDLGIGGPGGVFRGTHLVYTDMGGGPIWSSDYETFGADGTPAFVETAYAAIEWDERRDEFIQTGRIASGAAGTVNAHTQLTAPGGAPIWSWRYGGDELLTYGESVQPRPDTCGFVYAGRVNNPSPFPGQGAGDIYKFANNDFGETGCQERQIFTEQVAPLRPNQLPIEFREFREFFELPELTSFADGPNEAFCFDDDCKPGGGPCSLADLAPPFGILDIDDVNAFIAAFLGGLPLADIAPPFGVVDIDDVDAFIVAFLAGCP